MARASMLALIDEVRLLAHVERDDSTIEGESYWSDDKIQAILDRYRTEFLEPMIVRSLSVSAGSSVYTEYYYSHPHVETLTGGAAVWQVQDAFGAPVSTAQYSVNYDQRRVTFTTDTGGSAYYLRACSYDVYAAAADIWDAKAALVAERFDVSTDGHNLKRAQLIDHYHRMAAQLRARSKFAYGALARVVRDDLANS